MNLSLTPVDQAYGIPESTPSSVDTPMVDSEKDTLMEIKSIKSRISPSRFLEFVPKAISNSIQGVVYDMKSWNQLPTEIRKDGTLRTLRFIMTRDNREIYLFL